MQLRKVFRNFSEFLFFPEKIVYDKCRTFALRKQFLSCKVAVSTVELKQKNTMSPEVWNCYFPLGWHF